MINRFIPPQASSTPSVSTSEKNIFYIFIGTIKVWKLWKTLSRTIWNFENQYALETIPQPCWFLLPNHCKYYLTFHKTAKLYGIQRIFWSGSWFHLMLIEIIKGLTPKKISSSWALFDTNKLFLRLGVQGYSIC